MEFFKWLYRLPGRVNGSFGPTLAATGVEGTTGGQMVNPVGTRAVAEEINSPARSDKIDDETSNATVN